jgi:hypothetical protein
VNFSDDLNDFSDTAVDTSVAHLSGASAGGFDSYIPIKHSVQQNNAAAQTRTYQRNAAEQSACAAL